MTDAEKIQAFTQSVYLATHNRYFDDITGDDGVTLQAQMIDWTNQFIEELEEEAYWNYVRENDFDFGTIITASDTFALPAEVRDLVIDEYRPLVILQDGSIVSEWEVVNPNQITRPTRSNAKDRVMVLKQVLIFSRPFNEMEIGGSVAADIVTPIPRLASNNTTVLDLVRPKQLLILGTSKNVTLPDIVQGGTSPSFTQKYTNELEKAIDKNMRSSVASETVRDDYGSIGGIGF